MKPMMVRLNSDLIGPVRSSATGQGVSFTQFVNNIVKMYYSPRERTNTLEVAPIESNGGEITVRDVRTFLKVNRLPHKNFATYMLVAPETITRWLHGPQKPLLDIYQDRFKRVRKYYPNQPPI